MSSMARVSMTVFPEPVGDERETAWRSPDFESFAAKRMCLTNFATASSWNSFS